MIYIVLIIVVLNFMISLFLLYGLGKMRMDNEFWIIMAKTAANRELQRRSPRL